MFEYQKNNYIIKSDNHELSKDVLNWFPFSVYNILIPQARYFTCRYYKYMNDPFSEQYLYNQVIRGNILAWGMRTIMPQIESSTTTSSTQHKQQYISVCLANQKINPLQYTYNNLNEEKLDIPLNYFIIRELFVNISTFEVTCRYCNKFCIQMKIKFNTKSKMNLNGQINNNNNNNINVIIKQNLIDIHGVKYDIICSNQLCDKSIIDVNKLALEQGNVLIEYQDLPNYYNPNIRYYCSICFRCKICMKMKLKDPKAFCKKHLVCKHKNKSFDKSKFKSKKLKSLRTFMN